MPWGGAGGCLQPGLRGEWVGGNEERAGAGSSVLSLVEAGEGRSGRELEGAGLLGAGV